MDSGLGGVSCLDLELNQAWVDPTMGRGDPKARTIWGCITRSVSLNTREGIAHQGQGNEVLTVLPS